MAVTIYSAQIVGLEAQPISVEVDISPGLHIFTIVGLADKEVQESRERISAAIKNLGALAPHKKSQRVIVNLAPADIKKGGPAFDLPIALGYLLSSGQINFAPQGRLFLGELGLDGALRKVPGVLPMALAASVSGFKQLILPQGSGREATIIEGLEVFEVSSLGEAVEFLTGVKEIRPLEKISLDSLKPAAVPRTDFKDIHGQEKAKRALEIAAAGMHNILLSGPPGTGKTILARALSSILPPLSFEETLEVTKIHSVAGILNEHFPLVLERPFRSPHHTASHVSVVGGGTYPRPGEITLAHRGVLFLDEFPEFDRRVIEALRQPLEERTIAITRAFGTQNFPAQFMLVAAMNPCPCGNFGNPLKECSCPPAAVSKYRKKISGPMLDRIDLGVRVVSQGFDKIDGEGEVSSSTIRERVAAARAIQRRRFVGLPLNTNSEMGLKEIKKLIKIKDSLKPVLKLAYEKHNLSARSYHRVLKLARTIADLEGAEDISSQNILEALQYRPQVEN